jgi:FkbM family methyltransferase
VKLTRVLILLAVTAAIAGAAYAYRGPLRLFGIVVSGNSPVCPLKQAIAAESHGKQLIAIKDSLIAGSTKLSSDGPYDQWQTPRGTYWIPAKSRWVLPFNLAEQAMQIYGSGDQGVRSGDIVLDCGANVGVFAREALNAGAAKVVAIEPAPENVEVLRRNFKDEVAAGRVIVYPKGVWDKDDVLTLKIDPENSAADTFVIDRKEATGGVQVPLTTIDKLTAELGLARVDYIKMDIEGAEPNALRGGRNTIAKWKPRLSLSAYHAPDHPQVIPQIVRETRPDYIMECGPCTEANGHIRPDILWFR